MTTFWIVAVCVAVGVAILAKRSSDQATRAADDRKRRAEAEESEALAKRERLARFLESERRGWAYIEAARIGTDEGFIAMEASGRLFRLATTAVVGDSLTVLSDKTLPINSIRSITLDQPLKSKVITHIDKTPVAIQRQSKSVVGRAVVGTIVAGPLGAVVGGMSGLGETSTVEHHQTSRPETIQIKGTPVLVIATGDLDRPTVRLRFADNRILNEWSARLWAARGW